MKRATNICDKEDAGTGHDDDDDDDLRPAWHRF